MLFPVFRKFDSNSGEIFDIYPEYQTGDYAGTPKFVLFGFDDDNSKFEMNANDWVEGIKFTPSATYIEIVNGADMESIVSKTSGLAFGYLWRRRTEGGFAECH